MSRTLNEIAADFVALKAQRNELDNKIAIVEQELLTLPAVAAEAKESGGVKHGTQDYSVEIQYKLKYEGDYAALKRLLPAAVYEAVTREKREIDVTGMKKFIQLGGDDAANIQDNVKKKPEKPYIQVKPR